MDEGVGRVGTKVDTLSGTATRTEDKVNRTNAGIKLLCHVVAEQLPDCPASRSLREFVQNNAVTYQAPGQIKADPSQTVGLLCNAVAEQSESRFSQSSQDYTQNTLNAGPDTSSRRQGSSPSGGRPPNESYQLRRAPSKTKPISPTTTSSRQITEVDSDSAIPTSHRPSFSALPFNSSFSAISPHPISTSSNTELKPKFSDTDPSSSFTPKGGRGFR